jgi:hypothetical protein
MGFSDGGVNMAKTSFRGALLREPGIQAAVYAANAVWIPGSPPTRRPGMTV